MFQRKRSSAPVLLALAVAATAAAQPRDSGIQCEERQYWRNRNAHVCEIRELTLPSTGALSVDGGRNGGVRIRGADRDDVLVRAMVQAWDDDEEDARAIVEEVVIQTDGTIRAERPGESERFWAVSYEILVPREMDLDVETLNGGIAVDAVRGSFDLEVTNGGIRLDGVGGDVRARATNGGVQVTLTGDTWDGEGLDARTSNGGVTLRIPEGYSAELQAGTVNGRVHVDFPVTVQGRIGREIATTLGEGGPLVRATTTNGGVRLSRY